MNRVQHVVSVVEDLEWNTVLRMHQVGYRVTCTCKWVSSRYAYDEKWAAEQLRDDHARDTDGETA